MLFQPLAGWRYVEVTDCRTARDVAQWMKALVERDFPKAALISVVLDHVDTHSSAALYEAFPPAEARRILSTLDRRDTPTHGRWLHMEAVECAVLADQWLARRRQDQHRVRREVPTWEAGRHSANAPVHWQFPTAKARTRRRRLYPS